MGWGGGVPSDAGPYIYIYTVYDAIQSQDFFLQPTSHPLLLCDGKVKVRLLLFSFSLHERSAQRRRM